MNTSETSFDGKEHFVRRKRSIGSAHPAKVENSLEHCRVVAGERGDQCGRNVLLWAKRDSSSWSWAWASWGCSRILMQISILWEFWMNFSFILPSCFVCQGMCVYLPASSPQAKTDLCQVSWLAPWKDWTYLEPRAQLAIIWKWRESPYCLSQQWFVLTEEIWGPWIDAGTSGTGFRVQDPVTASVQTSKT